MSLSIDGFWKSGFWSQTFWADGFWFEGVYVPVIVEPTSTGGGSFSSKEVSDFLRYIKKKRKKALPELIEEIAEELAESPFAAEAQDIILESQEKKATKSTEFKPEYKIDYQALIKDTQALNRLLTIYQLYLDDEEAIALLLVS